MILIWKLRNLHTFYRYFSVWCQLVLELLYRIWWPIITWCQTTRQGNGRWRGGSSVVSLCMVTHRHMCRHCNVSVCVLFVFLRVCVSVGGSKYNSGLWQSCPQTANHNNISDRDRKHKKDLDKRQIPEWTRPLNQNQNTQEEMLKTIYCAIRWWALPRDLWMCNQTETCHYRRANMHVWLGRLTHANPVFGPCRKQLLL